MGLCKCPKRKVTNQFCFEHRVNVCEHCMVTNHPKCVIQSYLQWLQDSDCNPICILCSDALSTRECIRLTCYHVYHWGCFNLYAKSLSENEKPNYTCPTCNNRVIPASNYVSIVADNLRAKLSEVNWARPSLGLPLLAEEISTEKKMVSDNLSENNQSTAYQNHASSASIRSSGNLNSIQNNVISNNAKLGPPYSVVNVDSNMPISSPTARKVFEAYDDPKEFLFDHDENKYQRKSAKELFSRWWKLLTRAPARRRNVAGSLHKRYAILTIVGIGLFILIIIFFSWLGSKATDGDPSYNAINNPMINVNERS